jgi:mono/diheme cytochrome c family protein
MRKLLLAAALLAGGSALAAPVSFTLPQETAAFAPGPDVALVEANCGACHSADYVSTQPRGLPNPAAFWTGEVTKMRRVYKADIAEADMPAIVAYLVSAYAN